MLVARLKQDRSVTNGAREDDVDPGYDGSRLLVEGRPPGRVATVALADELGEMVHELAHEQLHRDGRRTQTNKTVRETEAEAVAFVVCQAIGFDTNTAAADYIRLYRRDAATLAASLHFIQSTATEILIALGVSDCARTAQLEA